MTAKSRCDAFLGRTYEGATVTRAQLVPATDAALEHCIVRGEMQKDLDFDVRMPTEWNHRTVFRGGGGFDGFLDLPQISDPAVSASGSPNLAKLGYATIATNHGHNSPGASFALDEDMLADYGNRGVPRVLAPAKAILRERYGTAFPSTKIVYEGCSGGGRQGLIEAQRYPDLFDGVISRAPANAYTPQFLHYQQLAKQLAEPDAALSPAKVQTISDAVLAKCDALDGLKDNIIGRPQACSFDPVELACTGAETDACLTPAQVRSAQAFYAPTSVANGRYTWPGFPPGGEAVGWGPANLPFLNSLGEGYIKYMVAQDPSVDWLRLDPAAYTSRLDQLVSIIDAVDPDLSRFKARGGKLILWTGLTDWLITANNATGYYTNVVQKNGGQAAADEFVEYYTSPGVQHCSGGAGADKLDLVGPMFEWLERGTKPSSNVITATQWTVPEGAKPVNRPVCRYPAFPRYVGGDPNAAASFVCAAS
ncbi:tannase/feruloyl esterase family alpha/beta hydrolase [Variovorax arabinosiphilus]|uniref:tannase/feruloyl esterase family alpha/beta hydrolase n=1 Tax=Variovorax arabinosiphilus TaxID=3053498 RepID=UPI002578B8FB|nr:MULTISPECIES: tannase/feruloyl esterase family alpha/beta hydrolase [unclassified Variovorax]MDM0122608.1 tannase/feruloyl esterase family alpha/beta hydrolase [Variovorax sp. J2L1-78]MDM0130863.1 tannase/feruloyl esterase family alpha/beta hydrolase [Variovorax sp. J2L1-63]MDM0235372.1 tannase/feruloyl esterase family alpha/beta hydrolase [Variovorax sp. J2R1-6]